MTTRKHASGTTRRRAHRAAAAAAATTAATAPSPPVEQTTTTKRFRLAMRQGEWQPAGEVVFRRSWPSRLDAKQEAMDTVTEVLCTRGWVADEDRPWLALCLDEAITNAMLHGNEGDPRLVADIAVAADVKRWQVAISDQGPGFSAAEVPNPDDPESLLLEHGRGIRLMRAWLGSLTYWRRGATVVLSRKRSDLTRGDHA